jgi:flagellar biosynthesis/type III secretory pathway protein FliH
MTSIRPMTEEERNRAKYRDMVNSNSNATVSVVEYIEQAFDDYYQKAKFYGWVFDHDELELLKELEKRILDVATQHHTTEAEENFEEGFNEGFEEGECQGYEHGFNAGYDQSLTDYQVEV